MVTLYCTHCAKKLSCEVCQNFMASATCDYCADWKGAPTVEALNKAWNNRKRKSQEQLDEEFTKAYQEILDDYTRQGGVMEVGLE